MGFKIRQRNQIDTIRKTGFVKKETEVKLETIEDKIKHLNANLGRLPDQRFVDAVVNMSTQFKRQGDLSVHQVGYLDYMITKIKS